MSSVDQARHRRLLPWTWLRLRLRHARRIASDVVEFGAARRLRWFLPLMVLVCLAAVAIVFSQSLLPAAVYTLL